MAAARPLISVLMPVRDGGDHLPDAVASILGQSLDDLELVVVDDGSRDGAFERLAACGDPRLRRYRNPGRGIVSALNFAAFNASGRYFARMDADDIALPTRLQRQIELLEHEPGIGIVGAEVEIFAAHGVGEGYRHYQAWINGLRTPAQIGREMFVESPIPHPTAMLSRTLFRALGGYRDTVWAEDYDLWLRAHLHGVAMAKPDGVLLQWRKRGRPVLPAAAAVDVAPALIVGAVGSRGARQVIRTELNGYGMVEGEDFLFAA